MQGLRLTFKTDSPLEDSSRILLSVDELFRILAWANGASTKSGSRPYSRTWRGVQGFSVREVHSGSWAIDLFAHLSQTQDHLWAGGALVALAPLSKLVAKLVDPMYWEDINLKKADVRMRNAEAHGKEIDNAQREAGEGKLSETSGTSVHSNWEDLEIRNRIQEQLVGILSESGLSNERMSLVAELPPLHIQSAPNQPAVIKTGRDLLPTIAAIANAEDIATDIIEDFYDPAVSARPPDAAVRAAEDAARAARRIGQYQRKSGSLEDVELIEDGV